MTETTGQLQAQYFGALFDGEKDGNTDVWDSLWVAPPPFDLLDVLLVAFAHTIPDPYDSSKYVLGFWTDIDPDGPTRLKKIVSTARAANPEIKILISLGYGTADLGNASDDPVAFTTSVLQFLKTYHLDDFDIDYEEFTGLTQSKVDTLFDTLGIALHGAGSLLTMSPAYGTHYLTPSNIANFDYIFPQTYGGPSVRNIQDLGVPNAQILNACHTEGAGTEQNENSLCQEAVKDAAGLGGVFNWRMDANFEGGTWDWNWNAIRQLHGDL